MSKKQIINIILALLFSVGGIFLLIKNTDNQYIRVEKGKGNYVQKRNNENIIYYLKTENGNYNKVSIIKAISNIKTTSSFYIGIFLAIIAIFGRDIGYVIRLRVLSEHKLSWKKCINTILLWEFSSAISPGTVGGSAVAMFIINKEGISLAKSTTMVFVATLFDNLFYVVIVPLFLLIIPENSLFPTSLNVIGFSKNTFLIGYLIIFLITCIFAYSLFISSKWIKNLMQKISKMNIAKKWSSEIETFGENLVISNKEIKGKSNYYWITIAITTFFSWISRFLVINAIIFAFGQLNFQHQLIILGKQSVMWIILLVTPIPGGSGVAEFMFSTFFNNGSTLEMTTTIQSILWRLISYYPYIVIGLILLPKFLLKEKKKL